MKTIDYTEYKHCGEQRKRIYRLPAKADRRLLSLAETFAVVKVVDFGQYSALSQVSYFAKASGLSFSGVLGEGELQAISTTPDLTQFDPLHALLQQWQREGSC